MLTIFRIFAPLKTESNFQQNPCNISHLALTLVTHHLGKFKRLVYHTNQGMCTLWSICRIHSEGYDDKKLSCCWDVDELREQLTGTWHKNSRLLTRQLINGTSG